MAAEKLGQLRLLSKSIGESIQVVKTELACLCRPFMPAPFSANLAPIAAAPPPRIRKNGD
jgi:hypothetical protein